MCEWNEVDLAPVVCEDDFKHAYAGVLAHPASNGAVLVDRWPVKLKAVMLKHKLKFPIKTQTKQSLLLALLTVQSADRERRLTRLGYIG